MRDKKSHLCSAVREETVFNYLYLIYLLIGGNIFSLDIDKWHHLYTMKGKKVILFENVVYV